MSNGAGLWAGQVRGENRAGGREARGGYFGDALAARPKRSVLVGRWRQGRQFIMR